MQPTKEKESSVIVSSEGDSKAEPVLQYQVLNGNHNGSNPYSTNGHPANKYYALWQDETIDWDAIIDEDDEPVDPLITEPHFALLTDPLYDSWSHPTYGKEFLVAANVGIFTAPYVPAIVPDAFLSLRVTRPLDLTPKQNRSYYLHVFGKPPDVAIEIVSNLVGKESKGKKERYAELDIPYYIIYDPLRKLKQKVLMVYKLVDGKYVAQDNHWMPEIGLGVCIWHGRYKETLNNYLRWCDINGHPIPTGQENADHERVLRIQAEDRAEVAAEARLQAEAHAAEAEARAERERLRAEQLAAQLRASGLLKDE